MTFPETRSSWNACWADQMRPGKSRPRNRWREICADEALDIPADKQSEVLRLTFTAKKSVRYAASAVGISLLAAYGIIDAEIDRIKKRRRTKGHGTTAIPPVHDGPVQDIPP